MPPPRAYPSVRRLTPEAHAGLVREVFSRVPSGYDFLNRLLSFRRDVAWRKSLARAIGQSGAAHLLDIATGTGDVPVIACLRNPALRVTGVDFVPEMILGARPKLVRAGLRSRVRLALADASRLPFPEDSFDAASVAFGIRNMPRRVEVLREVRRVLRPGGALFVLEMVPPSHALYRWYLTTLLPAMALRFTADPPAYHYLADSILAFPRPQDFLNEMGEAGFGGLSKRSLTFGITYLFSGVKPAPAD